VESAHTTATGVIPPGSRSGSDRGYLVISGGPPAPSVSWRYTLASFSLISRSACRSLHAFLVKRLIMMFQDSSENPSKAQLIFTTHDTSLLGTQLLRRDQIWLVEKDEDQASRLYPLSDFSPRKNEALEKGYLEGRYGGIPVLKESNLVRNAGK
jgi:AAA15 family ATPase/GTPase